MGWLGLSVSVLCFHHRTNPMVAQAQPWIADGAHDGNRQTRSTNLGQSAFRDYGGALRCLASIDAPRRRPLSLVTDARLATGRGDTSAGGFILPVLPHIPGKPVSFAGGPCPNRTQAKGDIHRAISLRPTSDVCCHDPFHSRDKPHARVVVRVTLGTDPHGHRSFSGRAGGTAAAVRFVRIRRVCGAGTLSPYPACLVEHHAGSFERHLPKDRQGPRLKRISVPLKYRQAALIIVSWLLILPSLSPGGRQW